MTIAEEIHIETSIPINIAVSGAANDMIRAEINILTNSVVREAIGEAAMFVTRRAVRGILNSTWKAINI
jgi:hypothetical protein